MEALANEHRGTTNSSPLRKRGNAWFWVLNVNQSNVPVVLSTFNQALLIDSSKHPLAYAAGYCFPGCLRQSFSTLALSNDIRLSRSFALPEPLPSLQRNDYHIYYLSGKLSGCQKLK